MKKTYATAFSSDCDIMERIDATGNRYEVTNLNARNSEAERPILDVVLNLTAISNYCKALAKAYKHIEEDGGVSAKYFDEARVIKEENPEVLEYLTLIDKMPIATVAKIKPEAVARHLEETLKFYY